MRNCFVPACDSLCKDKDRRMMFLPPKDDALFQKWVDILPKKRAFKRQDRVCDRHFKPEDIIKTWAHIIDGKEVLLDRDKPKLNPEAIPELNIPSVEEYNNKKPSKRKTLQDSNNTNDDEEKIEIEIIEKYEVSPPKKRFRRISDNSPIILNSKVKQVSKETEVNPDTPVIDPKKSTETVETDSNENQVDIFETLYDDIYDVTLPSTLWGLHRDIERKFIVFSFFDSNAKSTTKTLYIDDTLSYVIKVGSKVLLSDSLPEITTEFIGELLNKIEKYYLCKNYYKNIENCQVKLNLRQVFCRNCRELPK